VGTGLHIDVRTFEHEHGHFLDILLLELSAVEAGAGYEICGAAAERQKRQARQSPKEILVIEEFS
jgi:hypothetical protein